jgi:hypothetical protein
VLSPPISISGEAAVQASIPWHLLADGPYCPRFEAQLPMLRQVAIGAQGHQVLERFAALMASLDLVVDLEIL